MRQPPVMLGKTLGGRYQLADYLGGGGFGQTYLAEDLHLPGKPHCVVKQLQPRVTTSEALQMAARLFDTEAQVLYALGDHDQIPRLFAHFEEAHDFYLVQEFIEGDVLSEELKARGCLTEPDVIPLIQDVLTVLEFVHQQQVVHRDIKPSNLIRRKSDRRLVLIDFGAVKQVSLQTEDDPQGSMTMAIGSSGYMPNEQLAGKPRYSSDIYAVGMMAIQCLTGINPQRFPEDPTTSEIIWRDRVQVSPAFADILDTMVRYDYRQRYPSAKEALEALAPLTHVATAETLLSESTIVSFDGHLAWLERGDDLFQLQRYKEAIAAYDRVIQAMPNDYLTWFKRGIALENLSRHDEATAAYDRVVQLQPDDYLAWYKRGGMLEALQRHEDALESYDQVVQLQPKNYWAWHDRGRVLEDLRRFDDAIAAYDRAAQLKPDFQLAIQSRKRVLSTLQRVDTLYDLQHYDEAVVACERAIAQNPDDSLAWLMRGMALENLERYEDAIASYDRVVELQPDDHVVWFKRATLLEKLQRYEDAVASYYRVVQLQPDNCWAWLDRARLLEQLQQPEAAIAAYDRALQIKPELHTAVEGRRRALAQLHGRLLLTADVEDETLVSSCTDDRSQSDAVTHDLNAVLNQVKQELQTSSALNEAETIVRQAHVEETAIHPSLEDATIVRHPVPAPTAEVSVEHAPLTKEDQYRRWFQKGQALEKLQRYTEALVAYNQASQLRTDDPVLWRWRGNVLHMLRRYEEAISSYESALQ
ncbi:tetratricopeptide repeat protein, partial [Leptolyngbya sp. FACHB-36]|uniref:tetratricopeptide repeat protein n=1 Tax=Leptolyngbya sp. FACHB-36 TaxID=2692808 RepID=UPI0016819A64